MREVLKIENVRNSPFFSKDGFLVFSNSDNLNFYSFDNHVLWKVDIISQALLLQNQEFVISFSKFRMLYVINRKNGNIIKNESLSLYPKTINENFIVGEFKIQEGRKSIVRYDILLGELSELILLPENHYCSAVHNDYVLVGEQNLYRNIQIMSLSTGEALWNYEMDQMQGALNPLFYRDILILWVDKQYVAFHLSTGNILWKKEIVISAFDSTRGFIYSVTENYTVIDAVTGQDIHKVNSWSLNQIESYPALAWPQFQPDLSEEYLVLSSRSREDEMEGGIFFIDKVTAEVKDYFRIVFDKDPVQRKDWNGVKIPDDQQIPFMPLEKPIYKNGKLYVVLPSPIEGRKDLYVYERE